MRVEVAQDRGMSYSSNTQIVAKVEPQTQVTNETTTESRVNSIEIKDYISQNLGYQPTIQEKLIIDAIEKANQKILGPQKEFEFAIHKETKQIMVKVLDKTTKEVIREIPPEKVLDAVAYMWEIAGLFVDTKR